MLQIVFICVNLRNLWASPSIYFTPLKYYEMPSNAARDVLCALETSAIRQFRLPRTKPSLAAR